MPQQTNLNVAPYFDDFDPRKDYHRVLFKPGYPVQARELTTLQSILQNQIEKFGQHFFKEGAKVIPGNTGYNRIYYCVQLNNTYQGVPVAAYADQLIGTRISGQRSGVTAFVDNVLLPQDSERGNLTLYINYLNSSTENNASQTFLDGEELTCNTTISSGLLGNTSIAAGSPFALTLASNAAATGSSFQIQNGVYFIRGNFVNVNTETLILDQYSNNPNYRVGLYVSEEVVNADLEESLNDNSQGFNNYAAPGADRLKISVSLFKKSLDDFNDDNFVELATINDGVIRTQVRRGDFGGGPGYLEIRDTLARRTYAESGDYYVKPFDVTILDSLNDNVGNRGLFSSGQLTYGGSVASPDLAVCKLSPGKAFVRGYELETLNPTFIDVPKPRTTNTIENQSVIYNTGPTLKLNRVSRSPQVGLGNTYIVSLRNERVGVNTNTLAGKEIGLARVYDFRLESGSYSSSNDNTNQWNINLYDVQTTTDITLNEPISLSVPTFVKGANSGATAFLRYPVTAGVALTVYETNGSFIQFETLIFDGIPNGRIAIAVTENSISDVKSLYGTDNGTIGINTFTADVVQSIAFSVGIATVSRSASGLSTITSLNPLFPGNLVKENDLIQYTDLSKQDPTIVKVVNVGESSVKVSEVATVNGVYASTLPSSVLDVTDLKILRTKLEPSSNNTLYTTLPIANISDVNLPDASIVIRKVFNVNITSNQLSAPVSAGDNETFLAFDPERYSLLRSDGSTEELTADRFAFTSGGSALQIYNLGPNDSNAKLITTLRKVKPKEKVKIRNRVNSILIDKSKYEGSGIGATTLNDGLIYGNYPYGTRVQDELISLNVPDIIEIHGVYESSDTTDPTPPKVVLASLTTQSTTTSELIVGEFLVGQTSGATAICVEKLTDSQISFIYKNSNTFKEGETVVFQESNAQAVIASLDSSSFNISRNFTFSTGQDQTFYDYGYVRRDSQKSEPSKKIKVFFSNGYYDSTDDGDITTANSYRQFDYAKEVKSIAGIRNTDMIDIRPRVSNYIVSEGKRSPLEFLGRTFDSAGQSASNILASDENLLVSFSYYLGRVDRIYLTKDGKFQIVYGTPSDRPERPSPVDEALEIATLTLPPYLYATSQVSIRYLEHKRYRMQDIRQLENRIRNLEYYTSLSLLETNTANLFVPDADGLNRFKSGFFVDNFTSFSCQESNLPINNSIDRKYKELRPKHYTTSVDLIFGPVVNVDPTEDASFRPIEGNNVRKQSDVITLDYSEVQWLDQPFATRCESVTPFLISFWQGTLELTPESDTWVDTARLEAKIIETEGNYAETFNNLVETGQIDPQTGFGPILWDSWETNWTGIEITETTSRRTETPAGLGGIPTWGAQRIPGVRPGAGPPGGGGPAVVDVTTRIFEDTFLTTVQTEFQTRTGNRTIVTEQFDQESLGDRLVSRDLIPYMRSRNVQFVARRIKPLTRLYAFFDGVNVTKYCVPKLLEIEMSSGTFEVGETVVGRVISTGLGEVFSPTIPRISFRVADSNHREGPYNSPTKTYPENPYTNQPLPSTYSSTSTILNVDTLSLAEQARGEYFGWVETGMVLTGQSSGATAVISNLRLVSDLSATLIGSYFLPDPNIAVFPRFEAGTKTFTIINDEQNNQDIATTIAEDQFTSSGTLETVQENIISIRNAKVENKQEFGSRNVNTNLGSQLVGSTVVGETTTTVFVGWYDPLAQSFLVEDPTGIFVTKVDVFFGSKDDMGIPLVFQLRTMLNGYPTQDILPFSEIVLDPDEVNVSSDGSVATTVQMRAPVYLEGGKEYAICLASNSTKYCTYVARVGENDLLTDTFISNQPYLGSLFKSQNASTWEASQWEDLKFRIYRADFILDGSFELYSPELTEGNAQIAKLLADPLTLTSRRVRIGLASTIVDSGLNFGNTVSQLGTNATGNLVGTAGSAVGQLSISNAGIGYTPTDGGYTFNNVNLVTISGGGRGATANVNISNGVAIAATIVSGGSGYQVGDVLGITTIGNFSVGRNARFAISGIGNTNELILENVQGDFVVGLSNKVMYTNSSGITTELNLTGGNSGNINISSINVVNDGLHVKVNHQNHGMYFENNLVRISGVRGDVNPTKLNAEYGIDSTGPLSVESSTQFSTFENVGVGTTNTGYLLIGNEIIEYTSASGNIIGGNIVRGENRNSYPVGTPVYKYELGGVNLKRINKVHDMQDVTIPDPITFDSYNVKLDMSETFNVNNADRSIESGYPKLYLNQTKSTGGFDVRATQNIPFELITPMIQNLTVRGTSISAEARTITGQSLSGNEIPFTDAGFQSVNINTKNYLSTPRLICSKINEDEKFITEVTGNKSLNMRVFLNSVDSRVSPVVDGQRINAIFTSNRVDSIIEDYATDSRANSFFDDPTSCKYVSRDIVLENSASSIKIFVSAHINPNSDIRAFYAINNKGSDTPIFIPFPGWSNLDERGQVIDSKNNNGESDKFVTKTNISGLDPEETQYKEYVFTADNLPEFRIYRIKLLLTSTSQVYVPKMKELRVIALA